MARYSAFARTLHWVIALLVIANLILGVGHDALPRDWAAMPLHKSIGLTVLMLTIGRIAWRLSHPAPPLPAQMSSWEKSAAHAAHLAFYAFMLLLPLTGWIMSSVADRPLNWFFLFEIPKFAVTRDNAIVALSRSGHEVLGLSWAALIILHVAAALRHQFVLRDTILLRML